MEQADTSEDVQRPDRYTKAITQLASDKVAERLGGIYALEHLMRESDAEHTAVVAVLTAFIRENASTKRQSAPRERDFAPLAEPPTPEMQHPEQRPDTDVQAALTVLAHTAGAR